MESSNSLVIKFDIFERLSRNINNADRDKNFASKVCWTTGFTQSPDAVLNFILARKEFDLILAGSILKADKFESEYRSTQAHLPFHMNINGLMIVVETTMDEKVLLNSATRISKDIKKFKNHDLPNPYYLVFVRKLPADYIFYSANDVLAYKVTVNDLLSLCYNSLGH